MCSGLYVWTGWLSVLWSTTDTHVKALYSGSVVDDGIDLHIREVNQFNSCCKAHSDLHGHDRSETMSLPLLTFHSTAEIFELSLFVETL